MGEKRRDEQRTLESGPQEWEADPLNLEKIV